MQLPISQLPLHLQYEKKHLIYQESNILLNLSNTMAKCRDYYTICTATYLLLFLFFTLPKSLCVSSTRATTRIQKGKSINESETIVSPSGNFELGFFKPKENSTKRYVGIRYKNISEPTYVWFANRDHPVLTSSATLFVCSRTGNIVIHDHRMHYFVTNITSSAGKDVYAELSNSGNFVLKESGSGNDLWQSFDYPTDTLLPGMMFREANSSLVSWNCVDDPFPGHFSLKLDSTKRLLIILKNKSQTCYQVSNENKNNSLLFDSVLIKQGYFTLREKPELGICRLVLSESGQLKLLSWSAKRNRWIGKWESTNGANRRSGTTSEAEDENNKVNKREILIISFAIVTLLLIIFAIYVYYRRNLAKKAANLLLFDVEMSLKHMHSELPDLSPRSKRGRNRRKPCKLVFFSFSSVAAATENFSDAHLLGEGGFGPVYKGTLKKGDEVAIKRLSSKSRQGKVQFKNEAHLIARLQHKNLVRLLGCCTESKEQILIYEYMQNKSLDFFLYDSTRRKRLTWSIRVKIIEGIAQGLLYLHSFSRIQIIHRDLKPSNILLDNDMNPKISDFGMAKIFEMNQSHESTGIPVGTIGYISPEYAREGLFSERSDVYSFGVLFMEVVSGRKNTDRHNSETVGLLAYAWELWTTDRGLDLLDPLLEDPSAVRMILRYVHIALLCVQEIAADRPNMSQVVLMLNNSSSALPYPKPPGFLNSTTIIKPSLAKRGQEYCSVNDVSISVLEPR